MNDSKGNLTDLAEDEFDDSFGADGSDEELDWEEIEVPNVPTSATAQDPAPIPSSEDRKASTSDGKAAIEITLKSVSKKKDNAIAKARAAAIQAERSARLTCHKLHTVALLSNALTRNKWINDLLLQARLLSFVPLPIQASFTSITKSRHPDAAKRGRLFETALMRLTQWWHESFEVSDSGHIRSRTYREMQRLVDTGEFLQESGEVIRSPKSLMKHALMWRGCHDTSAQLFTAVCRALGIPARLVVSLQSVPWQANVGGIKTKAGSRSRKGKEKAVMVPDDNAADEDEDMEEVNVQSYKFSGVEQSSPGAKTARGGSEGALSKPVIRLRKQKRKGQRLGSGSSISSRQTTPAPPIGGYPPVFWTEVFSRADGRWMPVDPIRYIVNKRKVFEPPPNDKSNRMVYVVAIEEDGYARDVTPRYAREYGARTTKAQLGGKGKKEWWEKVMAQVTRPFRLNRDDIEDDELEFHQYTEGMPTSVAGFKDHPLYVLEQHLKRDEIIFPKDEIGKFRGEPVYPRSNVIALKTAENWMRSGRKVKEGCQPLKMVKQRAVTVHRRRAIEMAQQDGEEVTQGLYSEMQTELFVPDPVVNGVVPKNDFGNIDLYVPSMLPAGAAHVPYKGAAKIAKKLGFDCAEAVTSFEFKKGRAFPVISGVVIAVENEEALLEAYWETQRDNEEKERAKRSERALKRWTRLIQALRIRQRLRDQYAGGSSMPSDHHVSKDDQAQQHGELEIEAEQPGGFLTEADSVVQPFQLPSSRYPAYQSSGDSHASNSLPGNDQNGESSLIVPKFSQSIQSEHLFAGHIGGDVAIAPAPTRVDDSQSSPAPDNEVAPKTMREYAEQLESRTRDKGLTLETGVAREGSQTPSSYSVSSDGETARGSKQIARIGGKSNKVSVKTSGTNPVKAPTKRSSRAQISRKNGTNDDRGNGSVVPTVLDSSEGPTHRTQTRGNRKRKRVEAADVSPAPARVLRIRIPKNAEKLKLEKDAEEAIRRALEE